MRKNSQKFENDNRNNTKIDNRDMSDQPNEKNLVRYDPLQSYLMEIRRFRLLTRDEERSLGARIKEGDQEAAYMLVTSNLRLVVKIALEFQKVWMQNLLDLIQEGNIGLIHAVKKFDPLKDVKFSYYASFWIKAYILKFIMDNWRLVKIGTTQGQRKLFFKLNKEKTKLVEQGFDPNPKLISDRTGVAENEIIEMEQRLEGFDVSLDSPVAQDSRNSRMDMMEAHADSAEDQMAKKEIDAMLHSKIEEFKKQLTDRELDIFERRIFSEDPITLQELGDYYQISRERVRQLENAIINKIKDFFKQQLPDFHMYTEK